MNRYSEALAFGKRVGTLEGGMQKNWFTLRLPCVGVGTKLISSAIGRNGHPLACSILVGNLNMLDNNGFDRVNIPRCKAKT